MKSHITNLLEKGGLSSALQAFLKMVLQRPVIDTPPFPPKDSGTRQCRNCITKSHGAGYEVSKSNIGKVIPVRDKCSNAFSGKYVVRIRKDCKETY